VPPVPKPKPKEKKGIKRIDRMSKKDLPKWRKKAIDLAKKIVRKTINECEWCGKKDRKMDGAHIIPVRFAAVAADLDNILCLCASCHTLSSNSCHENPVLFTRWLDSYAPGRFERLWERARPIAEMTAQDWMEKFKKLEEMYKGVNNAGKNPPPA
jgi:hypothetical protein